MRNRSLRDLHPMWLGVGGITVIAAVLAVAFNIDRLPFVDNSTHYHAYLADAGGLQSGDAVIISGLPVGGVDSLRIDHGAVLIDFHVTQQTTLPTQTSASVSVRTLLGTKALKLEPHGSGRMPDGATIPRERTTAPYDVTTALSDLTRTTQQIDTAQLANAMNTLSTDFHDTPTALHGTLDGLNRLSQAVAARDNDLVSLLGHANGVTGVLAQRNAQVTRLLSDGHNLLSEINSRQATVEQLLDNTDRVASQLTGLVNDNKTAARPALSQLHDTLALLNRNRDNLAAALRNAVPFARSLGEAVSSGPFFQVYIQNLVPYDLKPAVAPLTQPSPRPHTQSHGPTR